MTGRNWSTFRKGSQLDSDAIAVAIGRQTFGVSKGAIEALGRPERVELLHDADAKVIGFRPTDSLTEGHKVRVAKTGGGGSAVTATAFLKYFDLEHLAHQRFDATVEDGVLCVDYTEPGIPIKHGRKPTAATAAPPAEPDPEPTDDDQASSMLAVAVAFFEAGTGNLLDITDVADSEELPTSVVNAHARALADAGFIARHRQSNQYKVLPLPDAQRTARLEPLGVRFATVRKMAKARTEAKA